MIPTDRKKMPSNNFKGRNRFVETDVFFFSFSRLAVYRLAYEQYKLSSDELADVHSSLEPIVSKMPSAMAKLDQKHSKSNKRITAAAATIDAELEELKAAIATMDTDMTRVSKELNTIQDRFEDYGVTISRNSDMV